MQDAAYPSYIMLPAVQGPLFLCTLAMHAMEPSMTILRCFFARSVRSHSISLSTHVLISTNEQ